MTNRDWALLGIRLTALWQVIELATAVTHFPFSEKPVSRGDIAWTFTTALIVVALWTRAEWLASRMFRDPETFDGTTERRSDERLLTPALSILGVYVVVHALENCASALAVVIGASRYPRSVLGAPPDWYLQLAATAKAQALGEVVVFVLGVVLILYAGRIAATVVDLRRAPDADGPVSDADAWDEEQRPLDDEEPRPHEEEAGRVKDERE